MTRKELNRLKQYGGYDTIKEGYCCYQEDGIAKCELRELGYNSGVYGWNWTAYENPKTNTLYISGYRNY